MSRFCRARPLTAQETIDARAAAARAAGLARMRDPYPPAALTEASPFHTGDRSMSVILSEPKAETAPPADPIAEWRALYHREEAYLIEQGLERRPARCDAWARTVAAMQAKEPGLGHYDAEAALHRGGLAHPNPTGRWASLRPGDICSPGSTAPPAIAQQQ